MCVNACAHRCIHTHIFASQAQRDVRHTHDAGRVVLVPFPLQDLLGTRCHPQAGYIPRALGGSQTWIHLRASIVEYVYRIHIDRDIDMNTDVHKE